jgi:acyl-CoA synthetase (NDP forming)
MSPTRYTDLLHEASERSPKPFYFMNTRSNLMRMELVEKFRGTGVGMLTGLRQGLGALGRMGRYARRGSVPPPVEHASPSADEALRRALGAHRMSVNEIDAKAIMRQLGLDVVLDRAVNSVVDAIRAADSIGYPVVLKGVSDDIPHRSEHGLVSVGISGAGELRAAWERHDQALSKLGFKPSTVARVVQPLARKGVEVNIGIGHDPEFGLFAVFGAGGVLIELISDAQARPLPLCRGEALDMVRASKVFRLLDGYRGAPKNDIGALVECIERVAALAFTHRDAIREIDLNPVFVGAQGQGCIIADALIVPAWRR